MLNFIFVMLILSVLCVGFVFVWSYCLSDKYWDYIEKRQAKKIIKNRLG